jgi:hypothetical protein
LPTQDSIFECVTLFDSIEKLTVPHHLLKEIHRTLRADGILQITTPDVNSRSGRLMGPRWYHYKPKESYLYFSPKTLRALLIACGFKVDRIEPLARTMRVSEILWRFKKYWPLGVDALSKLVDLLGLSDKVLTIQTGEMQAWARPVKADLAKPITPRAQLQDVCECPECQGHLSWSEFGSTCTQCEAEFSSATGILDFNRKGKASSGAA